MYISLLIYYTKTGSLTIFNKIIIIGKKNPVCPLEYVMTTFMYSPVGKKIGINFCEITTFLRLLVASEVVQY